MIVCILIQSIYMYLHYYLLIIMLLVKCKILKIFLENYIYPENIILIVSLSDDVLIFYFSIIDMCICQIYRDAYLRHIEMYTF